MVELSYDETLQNEWGVFFWRRPGFLSNWTDSPFTFLGFEYLQAEQAIMHRKALLFRDMETADKIMATGEPEKQKRLGRAVRGLSYTKWSKHRPILLMHILYAKFSQNQQFKLALLATDGKQIFESSPSDLIWGTGVSAEDSVLCKPSDAEKWAGDNILGKALMEVRDILSGKRSYDPSSAARYNIVPSISTLDVSSTTIDVTSKSTSTSTVEIKSTAVPKSACPAISPASASKHVKPVSEILLQSTTYYQREVFRASACTQVKNGSGKQLRNHRHNSCRSAHSCIVHNKLHIQPAAALQSIVDSSQFTNMNIHRRQVNPQRHEPSRELMAVIEDMELHRLKM